MVQVGGKKTWQEELFSIGLETGTPLSSTITDADVRNVNFIKISCFTIIIKLVEDYQ